MRTEYPSDITREQYELIRYELETARKATHPRTIDSYDIFCGILYRLKEGCRWRSLPHDYPKWQVRYYHYEIWRKAAEGEESVLDRVLRELVESERVIHGREAKTSMTIIDSKTIQNTYIAEEKGYDAGKKSLA
jgi:transposase